MHTPVPFFLYSSNCWNQICKSITKINVANRPVSSIYKLFMYFYLSNILSPLPCVVNASVAPINKPSVVTCCAMLLTPIFMVISQRDHWWGSSVFLYSLACGIHPTANERKLSHPTLNLFLVPEIRVELSYWADRLRYKLSLKGHSKESQ